MRFISLKINQFTALLMGLSAPLAYAHQWEHALTPTASAPQVIGQANNGCIAGATALPLEGDGYVVVHLERHRHYGHPNLINSLQNLGRAVKQQGLGLLQIGDLAQARGGPLPFGHRSHQTGIDADIWFNLDPQAMVLADPQRAHLPEPSMLNSQKNGLNQQLWTQNQVQTLTLAANLPEVERIFVNPFIKRDLCATVSEDRAWLHKIRPWYHHDDHFHLRLRCPADSSDCEPQAPIPAGDGCGAELDAWFTSTGTTKPQAPKPKPPLPKACEAVWTAP